MPEIKFIKPLTAVPTAQTHIHELGAPTPSAAAVATLAKGLGFETPRAVQAQDAATFSYKAGQHVVALYKASGAVRYQDLTRWQRDDGKSHIDMQDPDAEKLALAAIAKNNLALDADHKLLKVTRLTVADGGEGGKGGSQRVIDLGVAFQRTVGGVPVDGPGGKLIVYLDAQGDLTGFDRIWRPIQAVKAPVAQLVHPDTLHAQLASYWSIHKAEQLNVRETRFGYFEFGPTAEQTVLQPAYVMLITLVSPKPNEQITMNTVHVVPAASNAVGEFMPPAKKVVAQPARKK